MKKKLRQKDTKRLKNQLITKKLKGLFKKIIKKQKQ